MLSALAYTAAVGLHEHPAGQSSYEIGAFYVDCDYNEMSDLDQVIGFDNIKNAAVMLGMPGGQATIQPVQFLTSADKGSIQQLPANTPAIRNIAFAIEDIEAVVASRKEEWAEIFSEIQDLEGYKLSYVRGPEGIILELVEEIK